MLRTSHRIRSIFSVVRSLIGKQVTVETVEGVVQGKLFSFEKLTEHIYVFVLLGQYPDWKIVPDRHVVTVRCLN